MTEELVDLEAYREQLVEKLESMREFRSTESAESNADQLIDAHDARLRALAIATQGHDDLRRARYIEQEDHLIGRHGLSDGTRSTDELLAALAAAASAAD